LSAKRLDWGEFETFHGEEAQLLGDQDRQHDVERIGVVRESNKLSLSVIAGTEPKPQRGGEISHRADEHGLVYPE